MTFSLVNSNYVISFKSKIVLKKNTSATPPELLDFTKTCRDVTNDALIMWEAPRGCLPNDYCIHLKSIVDYVEAVQEQESSETLQVKSENFSLKWFLFCSNPPLVMNLFMHLLDCKPVWEGISIKRRITEVKKKHKIKSINPALGFLMSCTSSYLMKCYCNVVSPEKWQWLHSGTWVPEGEGDRCKPIWEQAPGTANQSQLSYNFIT